MKKLTLGILIFIFTNYSFSNDLINHIESAIHGQTYCIKSDESKEVKGFLKKHAQYAYNECKHEKYNQEDFKNLKKLAKESPRKYGYYLGMAYLLGFNDYFEANLSKAEKWLKKSSDLGNKDASTQYCVALSKSADNSNQSKEAFDCYKGLKTPNGYLRQASLYTSFLKQCEYIRKANKDNYLNAYPFYINCEKNLNDEFEFTKKVKENLKKVILDKSTDFNSKYIASILTNDKYYKEILETLLEPSDFKYHN